MLIAFAKFSITFDNWIYSNWCTNQLGLDVSPPCAGRRSLAFCAQRFSAAQARLSACRRPASPCSQAISGDVWMQNCFTGD